MTKSVKRNLERSALSMVFLFNLCLTLNSAASDIYLHNRSVESIKVDEPFLRVSFSYYPTPTTPDVCSIDIVTDMRDPHKPIQKLIDALEITDGFNRTSQEIHVVSDTTARFLLFPQTYMYDFTLRPKDELLNMREVIEKTLGKDNSVVVVPRSCDRQCESNTSNYQDPNNIYLRNTTIANINVDQYFLNVSISYPGRFLSGVCSIDIVADSYGVNGYEGIKNLIDELKITRLFRYPEGSTIQVVSHTTARIALTTQAYIDGFTLRPRDRRSSIRELIEKTLGKNTRVVVIPRSCE